MKRYTITAILLTAFTIYATAQDIYFTKKGQVSFYSKAPLENIEAHNNEVSSFIDASKAEVAFSLLIKGFRFEKALMEEHFNTNYLESDTYPKATFTGKIQQPETIHPATDGVYPVTVTGSLVIHGVSQPLTTTATVSVKNGAVSGTARFIIRLADFGIKIPSVVSKNIAETVEVTVVCQYEPYER